MAIKPAVVLSLEKQLKTRPARYWEQRGQQEALELFQEMAARVPAYKDFLKINKVKPEKIQTFSDFQQLPLTSKDDYLRRYPLEALCWDGAFKRQAWTISATSGSTGNPFYFPRTREQDLQYALTAELYLRTNFSIHSKSTLYINAFPMGVWIGGVFTYEAVQLVAQRGQYPLSIITPGINKREILNSFKNLKDKFDQVIIGAYAPFLKDVLEDGLAEGIKWSDTSLGFIFSAEGFSEQFRDFVLKTCGCKDPYRSTLNHYGTVDLGTMSYETPVSIYIRREAVKNQKLYQSLFNEKFKLPTLTQYLPEQFFFESVNNQLACTSRAGLPLVRYDLKDRGGVIPFQQMQSLWQLHDRNLIMEAGNKQLGDTLWQLPFVYVHERSDFSVSFFAFQIYPQTVRKALTEKTLQKAITGKFSMQVRENKNADQRFVVNIELKRGIQSTDSLNRACREAIIRTLTKENSEYRKTREEYGGKTDPLVVFWPYEDKTYFAPGTKQRWAIKNSLAKR